MSRGVNSVVLVGHVGQDPQVRTSASGMRVARTTLATSERVKTANGYEERTEWHRIVAFDKLAEVVEKYVQKGMQIYVRGKIEYSTAEYEGTTRYFTDVIVRDLVMLGRSSDSARESTPATTAGDDPPPWEPGPDGLPF